MHALRKRLPVDVLGFMLLCAGVIALVACASAYGDEPADLFAAFQALDCGPVTTAPVDDDALDLTVFEALAPVAATATTSADHLDVAIFKVLNCEPPANKDQQAEKASLPKRDTSASVNKLLNQSGVMLPATVSYPMRSDWWTHPTANTREGLIRHLQLEGMHAGKFDRAYLDSLTTAQLEALHSDDHEGKATLRLTQAIAAATVPAPEPVVPLPYAIVGPHKSGADVAASLKSPSSNSRDWSKIGSEFYWRSDKTWRPDPEPGTHYTGFGVLVPDDSAVKANPPAVHSRSAPAVRYQQSCPGGKCPTRFKWLW